jgi:NitT/TauT family transport system substrate-binding protein
VVAVPPLEQNALIYVAGDRGMFTGRGLDVTFTTFNTGYEGINAVLAGEVDIASAAEFPIAGKAFRKEPVKIIAVYDKFENDYIIARKDRGIQTVSDLKGKKIGVTLGAITEFYLGRFLNLNGLEMGEVTLVNMIPSGVVSAIVDGEVDAIIGWQPYVTKIQKELGDYTAWEAQSNQPVFGILVARADWLAQNADAAERFLQALDEAEGYILLHPDEAREIVRQRLNYDKEYLDNVWAMHNFSLSLDLSLIAALNNEARWMIENNLTTETQAPDFYNYIYVEGLKAVKPEAVNISR